MTASLPRDKVKKSNIRQTQQMQNAMKEPSKLRLLQRAGVRCEPVEDTCGAFLSSCAERIDKQ